MPFGKNKRFKFQILGFTSLAHAVHVAHASPTLVDTVGGEETGDSERDSGDSRRGCFLRRVIVDKSRAKDSLPQEYCM
jgi:hypothetical protein